MFEYEEGVSAPRVYFAYVPYVYSEPVNGRTALSCAAIITSQGIQSPTVARKLNVTQPMFMLALGNSRDRIKWDTRWCFGELDTTYSSGAYYWTTRDSMPIKGFGASQITPNYDIKMFVNPAAYGTSDYNGHNLWLDTMLKSSLVTPSLSYGTLVTSPVAGGNTHIKSAAYNENSTYKDLSSVVLDVGHISNTNIMFYVNIALNLDITFTSESDYASFYPGATGYDIGLIGGYNTKETGNNWDMNNNGSGYIMENNQSYNIEMAENFPTKFTRYTQGTYGVLQTLMRGYYLLRYPANKNWNPLKIPLPGFSIGINSALNAPGRIYTVRGYAMTIEGVYEL